MIVILHEYQSVELLPVHTRPTSAALQVSNHSRGTAKVGVALHAANLARHTRQIANRTMDGGMQMTLQTKITLE
jgi:hypothetical protein